MLSKQKLLEKLKVYWGICVPGVIWVFPKIGVPQNGWFIMENPIKMDGLGVPLFLEPPISALVRSYRSFSGARALLGHQLQGERHRFFATSEGLVLWDQLEWVSECRLQGILNIFKPWQKAVAPWVLFQAFRRGKAMRVMTFQCWCLGSSGPCWEVDQSPPKNNLHSEWFVDTSRLPPSNVPRREMPSSELGGKSIEFGPTVNLEVSTWKVHQNHRVYTLDIRIMVEGSLEV